MYFLHHALLALCFCKLNTPYKCPNECRPPLCQLLIEVICVNLVQLECTDLIMEVDKHVLEAAHCFSLDSNWGVVGNSIQDSSCS